MLKKLLFFSLFASSLLHSIDENLVKVDLQQNGAHLQELRCYLDQIDQKKKEALSFQKKTDQRFALLSIPASGAYFLRKVLYQLTGRESEEKVEAEFPMHYLDFSNLYREYFEDTPNTKLICLIRDLRDVFVSFALEHGEGNTIDEKLLWMITIGLDSPENKERFMKGHALEALRWMQDPNVLVFRYEDIVKREHDELDMREETVAQLAQFLEIEWSSEEKKNLLKEHWGKVDVSGSGDSFPNGKVGSWKKHFKEAHICEFKKRYGAYLIALGYESDNNW